MQIVLHMALIGGEYDENYDDDVAATVVREVDGVVPAALDSDGGGKVLRNNNTCGSGACSM